jgi:hypothetical protein
MWDERDDEEVGMKAEPAEAADPSPRSALNSSLSPQPAKLGTTDRTSLINYINTRFALSSS